ncbi:MAG: acyl-CoA dehydrogenase family protein [Deltaproteobacteria bacterium]|nr:acyl-CoA dehydrogenase family protein [Deltaproteobacteria bacterium]
MTNVALSSFDLALPTDEHRMLRDQVRAFTTEQVEPQALEHDQKERFNRALFNAAGKLGLLGITVSDDYGGAGMDATAAVIVHEELSSSDPGFCLAYLAHSMLCVNNLFHNASAEQKGRWLPKLVSGEHVGSMGMSEPAVGTDVLGLRTTATKDGDAYVVNGRKMWITNGAVDDNKTTCDVMLFYARTGGTDARPELSSFVAEKGMAGFSVGQKIHAKTGMRASNTAEMVLEDCRIPLANRIGEEGGSIKHMMRNLALERLTLAAMSLGIARRSIEVMVKYAADRKAFGKPLNEFGQIQKYIADSYAEFMACRAWVYDTARKMTLDAYGNRLDSDGVKLVSSTMGKNVADRAMQVLGGYGYVGEYVVERLWRDAKLLEIGGGTIEAHQKNMTRDLTKGPFPWA